MKLLRQFAALFRKEKLDAEMSEEMRTHLELLTERNLARGMSREEARYAALREFGGVEQIKERCRDRSGWRWLEQLRQDSRHAVRALRKNPGFALTAIVSLAIGIGANTAMFSVVHGVVLRPLLYPEGERLVMLFSDNRRVGITQQPSSYLNIADWQKMARTLDGLAFYDPVSVVVFAGEARRTSGLLASPNLAAVLGAPPRLGRMFTEDEAARREPVAVLSHAAWQQHYSGRADILEQRIEIDGRLTAIVGVMPERFQFPDHQTEVWLPHTFRNAPLPIRGAGPWRALARLRAGMTLEEAQAELSTIAGALAREYPANVDLDIRLVGLAEHIVGLELRNALLLLFAAVGAVLLIACSNVGNLLLARGLARQQEFALRISLGATRRRLIAQLLVENLLLCLIAAALGLAFAWGAIEAVRTFAPANIPRVSSITLDLRMLAFALALSLLSACGFGLLPALQSTRRDALGMLRDGARGTTESPRGRRLRGALVVVQFALAVVLLAGAGGLVRSFAQLLAVNPGFRAENVLVASLRLAANRPADDAIPFATAVLERVAALPGVAMAAISEEVLLGERGQQVLAAERGTGEVLVTRMSLGSDATTPDFFRVLGVPLRDGRFFTDGDRANAPLVVIVNETLAQQLWPNERAVGRRLRLGPAAASPPWATVVAVVGDQRRQKLERAPIPQLFWPLAQLPARGLNLIVRTERAPTALAGPVRATLRAVDPTVPLGSVTTLEAQMDRWVAPRRFHAGVLSAFAGIALVLAGVGIFGLMHYSVGRQTHEIGVRSALGATATQILRAILTEGIALAGLGVAIGLAGAIVLLRLFRAQLYEVSPTDPWSLGVAATALMAIAVLACVLPARRAAKIDPIVALRAE